MQLRIRRKSNATKDSENSLKYYNFIAVVVDLLCAMWYKKFYTVMGLKRIFHPKSIALIGANNKEGTVGRGLVNNLSNFSGKVFFVNPFLPEIDGKECYSKITDIKEPIDIAIIAIRAAAVEDVVIESCEKRVGGIIIISAGFAELGAEGKLLQNKIVSIANETKVPLIGPNCLGIINTALPVNASFSLFMPPKGQVAFISQSGALADSVIDWACQEGYGMSFVASYGNEADVNLSDFIDYFSDEPEAKVISVYVEGIKNGKAFLKSAAKASRKKPIILLKGGKTEAATKAVSSHTGSLAGSFNAYQAACRKSGVFLVSTLEEFLDVSKALALQPRIGDNDGIAIVTNGGGCGVLCVDALSAFKMEIPKLASSTIKFIDGSGKMHPAWSRNNPIDIVGDALPDRYEAALEGALRQKNIKGVIVLQTIQSMTDTIGDAQVVARMHKKYPQKPIVAGWVGGSMTAPGVPILECAGIPTYPTPERAARAMAALRQL